ncbi:MAG TPA: diguanylate cyclase [Dongiaceae bacterium]|nr:diguanylate cyclase [Dongiaceae bacterium]
MAFRFFARQLCWICAVWLCIASHATLGSTANDIVASDTAAGNVFTLTPFTQLVKIGNSVHYAAANDVIAPDAIRELPLEQWKVNDSATISLGFQHQPLWFRVDFTTQEITHKYWILELGNALIDRVDLYLYRNDVLLKSWHTGDRLPFSERPMESARFQFPLELQSDGHYQILMYVDSTEAMELPLSLTNLFDHSILSDRRSLVDGVFHGFLIIMAAYSLALYLILRDRSYLSYVAYVVSMLLFFLSQQGLLYEYFFPEHPLVHHFSIPWVSMLIFLSIAFFFREFLRFHEQAPRLWLAYRVLLIIHGLLCVGLLFGQYQTIVSLMALNVSISMVITFTTVCMLSWRGSRSAQIVLVGWGLLFMFILLFVLSRTGIFYNDFLASYGLRIGITLEILIFSFALSFRINMERKEKEWALNNINLERSERIRAQELALQREVETRQAKEQTLQLEIRQREGLQKLVDERTADLERTLLNLEKANQELEQLSSKDALTDLFNRRVFDTRLAEYWQVALRKQQSLSLLIIDVDHFKHINDSHGHQCGDRVLKELAALLRSLVHRPGDVIARYGGEEIAILLPDTPLTGATHVAETVVQAAAAKLYVWERETLHITVSIGVDSVIPTAEASCDQLVASADSALYRAKQSGRNRWVAAPPTIDTVKSTG